MSRQQKNVEKKAPKHYNTHTMKNAGKNIDKLAVTIIGVPSVIDDLSSSSRKALAGSDKIFCAARFYDFFAADESLHERLVRFPAKLGDLPDLISQTVSVSKSKHIKVAVLATGDPDFFGITAFLRTRFGDAIKAVLPAPSIMQEAFARLAMSWDDAGFFSIHGKSREGVLAFVLKHDKGFIFTSNGNDALHVLKLLKDHRLDDHNVYLFQELGGRAESITELSFPFLPKAPPSDLNALIFARNEKLGPYIGIGLPEELFDAKNGMITKRETRVNALSLLELKEGLVLWDIGAGSGSLAIEASFNPTGGLVFAIEQDGESFTNLKKNIERFAAVNVRPVLSHFLGVSRALPAPDRIFVGGGGTDWNANLAEAWDRLKSGGIIVVAAVTLDSLTAATVFFSKAGARPEVSGFSAFQARPAGRKSLFTSRNPVFLLKARKR